ncbi:MAG: heavy metal-responsive transcriptional regulator [Acidobacteria bacterium]|nr:heavy metal-responsive transcriptional regulator [Acidobacteriota bacterium]
MKSITTKTEVRLGCGMFAGETAKELGVGIQTLHFYEGQKLIPRPPRSGSGYRLYTPEIIERVRFIRKAQALGFSLDEIKEILGLAKKGTSPCGRVQAALAEKLREVDRRLEELRGFRAELAALIGQAAELSKHDGKAQVCSIVEESPPLSVTTITKPTLSRNRRREKPVAIQSATAGRTAGRLR